MKSILNDVDSIMKRTEKLSFPLFSSEKRKEEIVEFTKQEIDEEICLILLEKEDLKKAFLDNSATCWKIATEKARAQFESLPNGLKMNSFYLQEVMHVYVEEIKTLLNL